MALSCNVFPYALGLNKDKDNSTSTYILYPLCLGLILGVLFWLGSLLGSTFMHILGNFTYIVVFTIFMMIGARMIMNAYKVRKGTNIFYIETFKTLFVIGIVAGMNVFMIGLGAEYFTTWNFYFPIGIGLGSIVWSVIGTLLPVTKINVLISSLALFISSLIVIVLAFVYLVSNI